MGAGFFFLIVGGHNHSCFINIHTIMPVTIGTGTYFSVLQYSLDTNICYMCQFVSVGFAAHFVQTQLYVSIICHKLLSTYFINLENEMFKCN